MSNAHGYLAMPIYQLAIGIDPAILGFAMGIPRLVDAITDPIMGHISDNTHSRFGRRRPYIFIGAILSSLLFVLMWMPPVFLGTGWIAGYFLLISILYYIAYTVFAIPWGALGLELTEDYNERTKVQAFNMFVSATSGLFLGVMWKLSMVFGDNEIEGVRVVGLLFGGIILVTAIIPAIMSRERITIQKQKKISFKGSLKETVKNGPFMKLCAITMMMFLGIFLVNPFALYINVNYVFGPGNETIRIQTVEGLQEVIAQQGADKIIDAVSTQRAGQVVEKLALQHIDSVSQTLFITGVDKDAFDINSQDLAALKEEVTEESLAKTLGNIVVKNLKKNYSFYDIQRLLKRPAIMEFTHEVETACSTGLETAVSEIQAQVAEGITIIQRLDEAHLQKLEAIKAARSEKELENIMAIASQKLDAIKADCSEKELENIMATATYVFSKDAVSTFNIWGNVAFQGSLLLSLPVITWVSSRIGKKKTFMAGLISVMFGFLSSWIMYTPQLPYLQIVTLAFIGVGLSSTFMLGGSIIADICDIDELKTGRRREGMFGAMYAWVTKAGLAGTLILSGVMLNLSGYSTSMIFRYQSSDTILSMRQMYMIVPAISAIIAFLIMLSTPISEKQMHQVRAKLDALKAAGKLIAKDE